MLSEDKEQKLAQNASLLYNIINDILSEFEKRLKYGEVECEEYIWTVENYRFIRDLLVEYGVEHLFYEE